MNDRVVSFEDLNKYLEDKLPGMIDSTIDKRLGSESGPNSRDADDAFEKAGMTRRRRGEGPAGDNPALKGIAAARWVRALGAGNGDPQRAANFIKKVYDDELGDNIQKALLAGDLEAGGALVPPEVAAEIIELLRSMTVVRRAGARTVPMPNGTLTMRRQTAGSTAAYVGESQDITVTQPETGFLTMTSKKLAAIVPISNELLKFTSGPSADEFVRDDLLQHLSIREDRAFIRDDGTQHTPKGLRYWAHADHIFGISGSTAADIEADIREVMNKMESADVPMMRPAWIMHPTRKNYLATLRDATSGELIYPEMRGSAPVLYSYPVFSTTSIPTNLGGGGDESEVYFSDMSEALIGEVSGLELVANASASYVEDSTMKSAFSLDETLIRAIMMHDFAVRHTVSVVVLTGVTWGGPP